MKNNMATCLLVMAFSIFSIKAQIIRHHTPSLPTPEEERQNIVRELEDQTAIAKYANSDPDHLVRWTAVNKLVDQTLIADVAQNSDYSDARRRAVEMLDDQTNLETIVKNDKDFEVRQAAVMKLTNQELLAEIAKSDAMLRGAAIVGLNDKDLLLEIAQNDEADGIRLAAAIKLNEQTIITEVAKNAENNTFLRQMAIENLTDNVVLLEFANDKDGGVRGAANHRLDVLNNKEEPQESDEEKIEEKQNPPLYEVNR